MADYFFMQLVAWRWIQRYLNLLAHICIPFDVTLILVLYTSVTSYWMPGQCVNIIRILYEEDSNHISVSLFLIDHSVVLVMLTPLGSNRKGNS